MQNVKRVYAEKNPEHLGDKNKRIDKEKVNLSIINFEG